MGSPGKNRPQEAVAEKTFADLDPVWAKASSTRNQFVQIVYLTALSSGSQPNHGMSSYLKEGAASPLKQGHKIHERRFGNGFIERRDFSNRQKSADRWFSLTTPEP